MQPLSAIELKSLRSRVLPVLDRRHSGFPAEDF